MVYGLIRWTGTGRDAVESGDYRFFSTEYDLNDGEFLTDKKPRQFRPLHLDGLTLTNQPNNKTGQKPITNRSTMNTETPITASLAMAASSDAHEATKNADSMTAHEQAAVLHRKAAQAQADAGKPNTAKFHTDMAQYHDATAEAMRKGAPDCPVTNRGETGENMEILNRQRAAVAVADKQRNHPTWSYEQCRNSVRSQRPELFGLPSPSARRPVKKVIDETAEAEMANQQYDAVSEEQRNHPTQTYSECRNRVRCKRPELFGLTFADVSGVSNRASLLKM